LRDWAEGIKAQLGSEAVAQLGGVCEAHAQKRAHKWQCFSFDRNLQAVRYCRQGERAMKLRIAILVVLCMVLMLSATAIAQNANLSTSEPTILSDTHGYNFAPYFTQLTNKVRAKWYGGIPDAAKQGQKGKVVLIFTVLRNGAIQNLRIAANSGTQSLDQAATNAVQSASPFSGLPADFVDNHIDVQFTFLYNQR
jgi:TonB family protein